MSTKFVHSGKVLDMVAPSTITSGVPLIIGSVFGVPEADAVTGAQFPFRVSGVNTLPKATGFAPTQGAVAYWDVADGELNSDTSNPAVGVYEVAAASGDTEATVAVAFPTTANTGSLDSRATTLESRATALEARKGSIRVPVSLVANGTFDTYASLPQAATVTSVKVLTPDVFASAAGTVLLTVKKTNSAGNTILSAATYDLETASADVSNNVSLTATGADKQIAADGLIYFAIVSNNADATGPVDAAGCVVVNYTFDV